MAGIRTKVIDVAFDKISKNFPNFDSASGKKVVDSLFAKKPASSAENNAVSQSLLPSTNNSFPVNESHKPHSGNRSSIYDNFDHPHSNVKINDEVIVIEEKSENSCEDKIKDQKDEKEKDSSTDPDCSRPSPPRVDISQYLQKKSMAQGMLDLALLSANTNQLRYILEGKNDSLYFTVSLSLIISSLVLQVVVGLMLIWNSNYNVQKRSGFASADKINNLSVFGVFLITLINVFISTFGGIPSNPMGGAAPKIDGTTVSGIASTEATIPASVEPPPVVEAAPEM